jgi:hypothetical protein
MAVMTVMTVMTVIGQYHDRTIAMTVMTVTHLLEMNHRN